MDKKHIIFEHIDPPEELFGGILLKIDSQRKKAARIKLFFSLSGAVSSVGIFGLVLSYAVEMLYQSGAYTYISIIFSDPSFALAYSIELALSIAESLPLLEIAILLLSVYAFLGSFKYVVENISKLSFKNRLA